jgi:hypothetical protein
MDQLTAMANITISKAFNYFWILSYTLDLQKHNDISRINKPKNEQLAKGVNTSPPPHISITMCIIMCVTNSDNELGRFILNPNQN